LRALNNLGKGLGLTNNTGTGYHIWKINIAKPLFGISYYLYLEYVTYCEKERFASIMLDFRCYLAGNVVGGVKQTMRSKRK